ncbi:UNVERIFIED_CONTAM: hypothetical protein K2H54_015556 [Gekko kuhli]
MVGSNPRSTDRSSHASCGSDHNCGQCKFHSRFKRRSPLGTPSTAKTPWLSEALRGSGQLRTFLALWNGIKSHRAMMVLGREFHQVGAGAKKVLSLVENS